MTRIKLFILFHQYQITLIKNNIGKMTTKCVTEQTMVMKMNHEKFQNLQNKAL